MGDRGEWKEGKGERCGGCRESKEGWVFIFRSKKLVDYKIEKLRSNLVC